MTDGGTPPVTRTATPESVVTRDSDDGEMELLRVPISSTRQDREGDAFSETALEGMADQIRENQPLVFDDHGGGMFGPGYSARESIGALMDAEIEDADDGHKDLFAFVNPDGSHEEGSRMLAQVREENQPIKFSVGFGIHKIADDMDHDERPDRADEVPGRLFMETDLMETSRVGIPANPDASVTMAAKHPSQRGTPIMVASKDALRDALGTDAEDVETEERDTDTDETDDGDGDAETVKATCPECGADVPDGANYCPECGEELGDDDARGDDEDGDDDEDDEETESIGELREEIAELREAVKSGTGSPESADTDTTPDETDDADADDESTDDQSTESERDARPFTERRY